MRLARLTEVQRRCWASVRDGRDVVGVAPTGSGKTLAYMLPLAAALANPQRSGASPAAVRSGAPRALVLTPTRELAQQVASVGERVFSAAGAGRVCAVHGGTVRAEQRAAVLSAPPIALLVGTPGRVLDLAGASSSAAAAATAAAGGGGCSAGSSSAGSSSAADGKSSCRTATVSYSGDATAASAPASLCLHAVRWLILDEADKLLLSSDLQSQVRRHRILATIEPGCHRPPGAYPAPRQRARWPVDVTWLTRPRCVLAAHRCTLCMRSARVAGVAMAARRVSLQRPSLRACRKPPSPS